LTIPALLERGGIASCDDPHPSAPTREYHEENAATLGRANCATTLLAGEVVDVARDPPGIEKSLLCLLRLDPSLTDMVEIGAIPVEVRVVRQSVILRALW
jgi:hypothetical protein